jgi:hypothetical protein
MLNRLRRWWNHRRALPCLYIPPGHAYYCLACRYVCRGTTAGTCQRCRSEAVYPVRPLLYIPSRPAPGRSARETVRVVGEDENTTLWLTEFRRTTKNGGGDGY